MRVTGIPSQKHWKCSWKPECPRRTWGLCHLVIWLQCSVRLQAFQMCWWPRLAALSYRLRLKAGQHYRASGGWGELREGVWRGLTLVTVTLSEQVAITTRRRDLPLFLGWRSSLWIWSLACIVYLLLMGAGLVQVVTGWWEVGPWWQLRRKGPAREAGECSGAEQGPPLTLF